MLTETADREDACSLAHGSALLAKEGLFLNSNDYTEPTSFHGLNRSMRVERSQQQRLTASRQLGRNRLEDLDRNWNLTLQRTKANGQTMMVAFFHCGAGSPIARWWVVSQELIFADGEKVYGIADEAAAVAEVKNSL